MKAACHWLMLMCVVFAVNVRTQTPVEPQQTPITLDQLEQLAIENNPTARAAQAAIEAARGRVRQAGAWPNPTIGYTGEEITTRG